MKKQFLLGLMAMLLPLTSWAQFDVTVKDVSYQGDAIDLSDIITVKDATKANAEVGAYAISYYLNGVEIKSTEVRNVGTYTAKVSHVGDKYLNYDDVIKTFTIKPYELSSVKLTTVHKAFDTADDDIDLSLYVTLNDGDLQKGDKMTDAVKCLKLKRLEGEGLEDVQENPENIKVYVTGKEGGNYTYTFTDKADIVNLVIDPLKVTVTTKADTYNGKERDLTAIGYTVKDEKGKDVSVTPKFVSNSGKLKDAKKYELKVTLDSKNYETAATVNYEIKPATLLIEQKEDLSKTYDGKKGLEGSLDLTDLYSLTSAGVDANSFKTDIKDVTMQMEPRGLTTGKETGADVDKYLVHPTYKGTPISINDYNKTIIPNYVISYKRAELTFEITPKDFNFYFVGDSVQYDGKQKTAIFVGSDKDNGNYTVVYDKNQFVGESKSFNRTPRAKFAETDVKNVGTYTLVWDETEIKVGQAGEEANYNFVCEAPADEENPLVNTLVITPAEMIISGPTLEETVVEQEDGTYRANIDKEQIEKDHRGYNKEPGLGVGIKTTPSVPTDIQALRPYITIELDEAAVAGESGEYDIDVIINFDEEGVVEALLANYGGIDNVTINKGVLTIGGVNADIILDGGENPEDEIMDLLTQYDGVKVNTVTVKNLRSIRDAGIKADKWYSLVLPFKVSVRDLSKAFGYAIVNIPDQTNAKEDVIKFNLTMHEIPANTLMAFKVDEDMDWEKIGDKIVFEGVKIEAPKDMGTWVKDAAGNEFVGVYEETTTVDNVDSWIWTDGSFWKGSTTIYPMSGYIRPKTANARIIFEGADGTTTAISAITEGVMNTTAEGWYTVGGVKLNAQPTQKGIYINNGKKIVIK